MKNFLFLLLSVVAASAHAAMPMQSKGQAQAYLETLGLQVPNSLMTQVGDKQYLNETGNQNLLVNPSFEHSTVATGWTVNGTNITAAADATAIDGVQSLSLTENGTTYTDTTLVSQTYTATSNQNFTGQLMEATMRVKTFNLSAQGVSFSLCVDINSVNFNCYAFSSTSTLWQTYTINFPGTSASSTYKIYVKGTVAGFTGGTFYLDNTYLGLARNTFSVAPANTFSAKVSSAGVVSDESPEDWISGNCSVSDTSLFTCTFPSSKFSVAPTCTTNFVGVELAANGRSNVETQSSTSVAIRTGYSQTSTSFTKQPYNFNIVCQRASTDYIYTGVINANQFDTQLTTFTPSLSTGAFATGSGVKFSYALEGQFMRIIADYLPTGTGTIGSGTYNMTIPGGYTIDVARSGSDASNYGSGYIYDGVSKESPITVGYSSATQIQFKFPTAFNTMGTVGSSNFPLSNSSYRLGFNVLIPIAGRIATTGTNYLPAGSINSYANSPFRFESATIAPASGASCPITNTGTGFISSTTPNAAGDCTINFVQAFPSTNYQCFLTILDASGASGASTYILSGHTHTKTTSSARIITHYMATGSNTIVANGGSVDVVCIGPRY